MPPWWRRKAGSLPQTNGSVGLDLRLPRFRLNKERIVWAGWGPTESTNHDLTRFHFREDDVIFCRSCKAFGIRKLQLLLCFETALPRRANKATLSKRRDAQRSMRLCCNLFSEDNAVSCRLGGQRGPCRHHHRPVDVLRDNTHLCPESQPNGYSTHCQP
jgi:hypothetical protein